jgi:hypothetical protein
MSLLMVETRWMTRRLPHLTQKPHPPLGATGGFSHRLGEEIGAYDLRARERCDDRAGLRMLKR